MIQLVNFTSAVNNFMKELREVLILSISFNM